VFDQLHNEFDAIVMFTWSNWWIEPRSNRYHYATRLAKRWPVYFVQATAVGPSLQTVEKVDGHDIHIVHINSDYGPDQSERLIQFLKSRGVARPLHWVYNPCYIDFIERHPGRMLVYHATEDYLGVHKDMPQADAPLIALFRRLLQRTDLVVAVTEAVGHSTKVHGNYDGPLIVLRNGCDADHWRSRLPASPPTTVKKTAIYQGGVNARLDFDLMAELASALPDWQFWICGNTASAPQPGWNNFCALPNVRAFGEIHPDQIAELQAKATVGIIPFRQITLMQASLPLKAYEYVASGLPVITIPIDELNRAPDLFDTATTTAEFAATMEAKASTRWDPAWLDQRFAAANAASYDARFGELMAKMAQVLAVRGLTKPRLNVLVLYDDGSIHVAAVREHLESFKNYSRHNIYYLPASVEHPFPHIKFEPDFGAFDVLIIHYSVRISTRHHLPGVVAEAVEKFSGPKIAFLQDEYDTVEIARGWLERLNIGMVFTCVPELDIDKVYPRARFPDTRFVHNLTGYVPESPLISLYRKPLRDRKVMIGYRGRQLPLHYGDLGQEKYEIGLRVRQRALELGVPVDIEVENESRIYGSGWYEFLANARATLGTESGSNVFDDDGSLARASQDNPQMSYGEFRETYLAGREGPVNMNQISPKIFESVILHVALVLFEGSYSGVIAPGEHYLALKKDYSNLDEVLTKLNDVAFLEELTSRAFEHVIGKGLYSYSAFVQMVDRQIDRVVPSFRSSKSFIMSMPMLVSDSSAVRAFGAPAPFLPSTSLLPPGLKRPEYWALLSGGDETRELGTNAGAGERGAMTATPSSPGTASELSRLVRMTTWLKQRGVPDPLLSLMISGWYKVPLVVRNRITR
jgi:glycosyltransferase involved in cell wall biosynthesis